MSLLLHVIAATAPIAVEIEIVVVVIVVAATEIVAAVTVVDVIGIAVRVITAIVTVRGQIVPKATAPVAIVLRVIVRPVRKATVPVVIVPLARKATARVVIARLAPKGNVASARQQTPVLRARNVLLVSGRTKSCVNVASAASVAAVSALWSATLPQRKIDRLQAGRLRVGPSEERAVEPMLHRFFHFHTASNKGEGVRGKRSGTVSFSADFSW
jgi:hypothetical protein